MPRFVHIDIAADDPEREAAFFRDVFGWQVIPGVGMLVTFRDPSGNVFSTLEPVANANASA